MSVPPAAASTARPSALASGFGRFDARQQRVRCPDGLIARNNQQKPLGHIGLVLRRTGQDQQASVGKCREVSNPSPWGQRQSYHPRRRGHPRAWARRDQPARARTMNACPFGDGARSPNSSSSPSPNAGNSLDIKSLPFSDREAGHNAR